MHFIGNLSLDDSEYKILLVDDNLDFINSVKTVLKNFSISYALTTTEAKQKLNSNTDLVLLDLVFDEKQPNNLEGLNFLEEVKKNYINLPVVIITNHTDTEIIVKAIKSGATDFINKKNLNWTEWKIRLESYCESSSRLRTQSQRIKELELKYDDSEIVGISPPIEFLRHRLKDLAENSDDVNIFICGETGTGKNLAVRYFKKHSRRKEKPFKEFSLFELSDTLIESELFGHTKGAFTGAEKNKNGLFEEADGGILFLDEIGDYDLRTQKKIMRFIDEKVITPVGSTQSKKLDIQLIMATNQNLQKLINEGKFREDLYQRINRIKIELPPLRERKGDIKVLTDYFFSHFKEKEKTNLSSVDEDVYNVLEKYDWPGNVRELQSVIWDACTKARLTGDKVLNLRHIREEIKTKKFSNFSETDHVSDKNAKIAMLELEEIEKALQKTNGKKSDAAKMLGMSLDQMRYKVEKIIQNNFNIVLKFPLIQKEYRKLITN